jgi:hypothetical protein
MSKTLTFTGRAIDLSRRQDNDFAVNDIAHALSQQCRFHGHTRQFYSYAQHAVMVSKMVPVEYRLEALFYESARVYRHNDKQLRNKIYEHFGICSTEFSRVKLRMPVIMKATERRDLMAPSDEVYRYCGHQPTCCNHHATDAGGRRNDVS